ncbi:hypothetical protein, partial [Paraclostridium sordellii]|uniref:hypothetical protein n=1 Tax=Paraclostridium sordellii TaxID=1505 RepID=UPI000AE0F9CD
MATLGALLAKLGAKVIATTIGSKISEMFIKSLKPAFKKIGELLTKELTEPLGKIIAPLSKVNKRIDDKSGINIADDIFKESIKDIGKEKLTEVLTGGKDDSKGDKTKNTLPVEALNESKEAVKLLKEELLKVSEILKNTSEQLNTLSKSISSTFSNSTLAVNTLIKSLMMIPPVMMLISGAIGLLAVSFIGLFAVIISTVVAGTVIIATLFTAMIGAIAIGIGALTIVFVGAIGVIVATVAAAALMIAGAFVAMIGVIALGIGALAIVFVGAIGVIVATVAAAALMIAGAFVAMIG